jgi:hydroxymethylbilane synthase
MSVVIGSRKSHLAQVQARKVNTVFKDKHPDLKTELYLRPSYGDLNLDMDLSKTDQKGVFTQDFLELLENGGCDMVVHSWKDLPIEDTGTTRIVSTLDREDSRDLFLIKKKSLNKKNWNVLTSSPRREFNLEAFFDFLSEGEQELSFSPIRGNIPTRFEKFVQDDTADGFCVALAAVKRLKDFGEFNEENIGIWSKLDELCNWCILPESYCPSAAAQGALAIEVLNTNLEVIEAAKAISHPVVFDAIVKERQILKTHGGGCHLAVGATVISHDLGELVFTAGRVDGPSFRSTSFTPHKKYPSKIEASKVWLSSKEVTSKRTKLAHPDLGIGRKAFVATKYEGLEDFFDKKEVGLDVIFAAGLKTWKKFYTEGVWIQGCLDNLGEDNFEPDVLHTGFEKIWLTRQGVKGPKSFKTLETYGLETSVDPKTFKNKEYFVWTSGELFANCLLKHPELKKKQHFLGMGRSRDALSTSITEGVEVWPYYTVEQVLENISN